MLSLLDSLNLNCLAFWNLPITRDLDQQPEYYIGQIVFHVMNVREGQILYPVRVLGLSWTGSYWQYSVVLPEEHPWFAENDCERDWVDDSELEAI